VTELPKRVAVVGVFLISNYCRMNTMTNISDVALRDSLTDILQKKPYGLEAEVIREALDYHNISDFFSDLVKHGCITGMVDQMDNISLDTPLMWTELLLPKKEAVDKKPTTPEPKDKT